MITPHPESSHQLKSSKDIQNYLFGGQGVVTLRNPKSKVEHTYVFRKPNNEDQFPADVIFVYALHNNNQLFYVGMVEDNKFRLTRHSRFLNDTPIVKGARYIMRMANEPNLKTYMELWHQGVCAVCGRKLTNSKSIQSGIGPRCKRKLHDVR